jgi:hypothetical protein
LRIGGHIYPKLERGEIHIPTEMIRQNPTSRKSYDVAEMILDEAVDWPYSTYKDFLDMTARCIADYYKPQAKVVKARVGLSLRDRVAKKIAEIVGGTSDEGELDETLGGYADSRG